ncbi:blue light receptor, partial [Blyttiomyces sp. JEL0837]
SNNTSASSSKSPTTAISSYGGIGIGIGSGPGAVGDRSSGPRDGGQPPDLPLPLPLPPPFHGTGSPGPGPAFGSFASARGVDNFSNNGGSGGIAGVGVGGSSSSATSSSSFGRFPASQDHHHSYQHHHVQQPQQSQSQQQQQRQPYSQNQSQSLSQSQSPSQQQLSQQSAIRQGQGQGPGGDSTASGSAATMVLFPYLESMFFPSKNNSTPHPNPNPTPPPYPSYRYHPYHQKPSAFYPSSSSSASASHSSFQQPQPHQPSSHSQSHSQSNQPYFASPSPTISTPTTSIFSPPTSSSYPQHYPHHHHQYHQRHHHHPSPTFSSSTTGGYGNSSFDRTNDNNNRIIETDRKRQLRELKDEQPGGVVDASGNSGSGSVDNVNSNSNSGNVGLNNIGMNTSTSTNTVGVGAGIGTGIGGPGPPDGPPPFGSGGTAAGSGSAYGRSWSHSEYGGSSGNYGHGYGPILGGTGPGGGYHHNSVTAGSSRRGSFSSSPVPSGVGLGTPGVGSGALVHRKPASVSPFFGMYSNSGFDMIKILSRVQTRPNPQIDLGPVDLSSSFVVVDARKFDFPIIYVSESFENLTGYKSAEILAPDGNVTRGARRQFTDNQVVYELKKSVENREECQFININYKKGGEPFVNLITVVPVTDEHSDEVAYFVGFQVDLMQQSSAILRKLEDGSYAVDYEGKNVLTTGPTKSQHHAIQKLLTDGGPSSSKEFGASTSTTEVLFKGEVAASPQLQTADGTPWPLSALLGVPSPPDTSRVNQTPQSPVENVDAPSSATNDLEAHFEVSYSKSGPSTGLVVNTSTLSSSSATTPAVTIAKRPPHLINIRPPSDLDDDAMSAYNIVQNSSDLIHILSSRGIILYASPTASQQLLEYEAGELIGRNITKFSHPGDAISLMRDLKTANLGDRISAVYRFQRKVSGYVWLEVSGHKYEMKNRKKTKCFILSGRRCVFGDLAMKSLVESLEGRYLSSSGSDGEDGGTGVGNHEGLDCSAELWAKVTLEGLFLHVSERSSPVFGIPCHMLGSRCLLDLVGPQDRDVVAGALKRLLSPRSVTFDPIYQTVHVLSAGSWIPAVIAFHPFTPLAPRRSSTSTAATTTTTTPAGGSLPPLHSDKSRDVTSTKSLALPTPASLRCVLVRISVDPQTVKANPRLIDSETLSRSFLRPQSAYQSSGSVAASASGNVNVNSVDVEYDSAPFTLPSKRSAGIGAGVEGFDNISGSVFGGLALSKASSLQFELNQLKMSNKRILEELEELKGKKRAVNVVTESL